MVRDRAGFALLLGQGLPALDEAGEQGVELVDDRARLLGHDDSLGILVAARMRDDPILKRKDLLPEIRIAAELLPAGLGGQQRFVRRHELHEGRGVLLDALGMLVDLAGVGGEDHVLLGPPPGDHVDVCLLDEADAGRLA
ncbi:hypothetical protein D3C72_1920490 [compost metagenome]